jgi:hypothetical protein
MHLLSHLLFTPSFLDMIIHIIWTRLGFLVFVFVLAAACLCELGFDRFYGHGYYSAHKWTIGTAMLIAAGPCWAVGRLLRRRAKAFIDPQTGRQVLLDSDTHTLFFIRMDLWGPILLLLGTALFAVDFFPMIRK